ncbi:MAG: hypothetical protein P4L64_18970 [Caulobacteraceae bacterium]|nr:hypothetical protein [Caulobacteraceae bacterium]
MSDPKSPALSVPAPQPEGRVDRIASVGARDTLDRLSDPDLLQGGAVNLIGLDAIRAKLADRWEARRGRIWEHVEREIGRTIGPADLFLRLDDVTYLVALPSTPGFSAQAVCLTVLQDVLKFFLGELSPADVLVRTVSQIEGGQISSAPVDLRRLHGAVTAQSGRPAPSGSPASPPSVQATAPATPIAAPLGETAPAAPIWKPPLAGRSSHHLVEPPARPKFDLTLNIEPVWNLKRGLITSFVVDRGGLPTPLDATICEEIDMAVVRHAAKLLQEHARQGGPLAVHVPLHFSSLANQRSRLRLLGLSQAVREAMRQCVLIEICGLDAGVPPSRLIEVVGLVRSLCAGVLGRVRPSRQALAAARGCGLRGLVIEAALLSPQVPEAEVRLKAFAAAATDINPNVIIHGLPNPLLIDMAASAGFTHASAAGEVEI